MNTSDRYELINGAPEVTDYVRLRAKSGLSPKSEEQGRGAIAGSWSFRHVRDETGQTVAMGRIVGDGGWYFLIADMATLPEHQGRGLGGKILDALLEDIRRRAPQGAYVTLTADPPGRRMYESRGFSDIAPDRTGMHLLLLEPPPG